MVLLHDPGYRQIVVHVHDKVSMLIPESPRWHPWFCCGFEYPHMRVSRIAECIKIVPGIIVIEPAGHAHLSRPISIYICYDRALPVCSRYAILLVINRAVRTVDDIQESLVAIN